MIFRRISDGPPSNKFLYMSEIRAYQSTNLLKYGAKIIYQTEAIDLDHQAENLIENLESRSSSNNRNAKF